MVLGTRVSAYEIECTLFAARRRSPDGCSCRKEPSTHQPENLTDEKSLHNPSMGDALRFWPTAVGLLSFLTPVLGGAGLKKQRLEIDAGGRN